MASSPSKASAATRLLRDLIAAENLVARLDATAPEACQRHGGAQAMLAAFGVVTCVGFWRLEFGAEMHGVWEEMASEQQARHRGDVGE